MTEPVPFTDAEATNEALLLFTRKLRRLHPGVFSDVIKKLPEGARFALVLAENRADMVRAEAERTGVTRRYMTDVERYGSDVDDDLLTTEQLDDPAWFTAEPADREPGVDE
jgi:hypothetical protein